MSTVVNDSAAHNVRWDLSALFQNQEDPRIDQIWTESHRRADAFAQTYRGNVSSLDAAGLVTALNELEAIINESSKPAIYSNLLFAADASSAKIGAFLQEQTEKSSELRVKLMFFDLELQQVDQSTVDSWLADPSVEPFRHHLHVVRAMTPYMLSETEEVLLEETANVGSRAWVRLHEEVTANHVFHYTDPKTGDKQELAQEEVIDKLRDADRDVRQAAADSLTQGLDELNRVICLTYNTLLADKKLEDRLRKMEYAEQSRHLANELDKETVDLVMQLCKERSDSVSRYYTVKKQILGLDHLTHIDRYAPLFDTTEIVDWPKARAMVLDSFGEFSPVLRDRADEFFVGDWIDAEPRQGKTGGAFCSYNTPDTHPVIMMTYLGKLGDVMTLAHELGHGVHASLSRKQNLYNFHGTLPLAELASIFGEMLVFDNVVATASPKDKLALYAEKIEGLFATVHRQSAMFRFEQRCHEHRRTSGELSSEQFGEFWQAEMQSMFGSSVELGDQHKQWWSYVGHFFFAPFYVYAYSFGELLTLALYQQAQNEGPGFADKYLDVLERGGSETPHELMARLGVDLRSREFWLGGFAAIDTMVAKFEELWRDYSRS